MALQSRDLLRSPLSEIIPFRPGKQLSANKSSKRSDEPWFDRDLEFKVGFSDPSMQEKELATIFQD